MSLALGNAVNEVIWEMPVRLAADVPEKKVRQFGEVRACYGALPTPAVNRIYVFDQADPENLEAAMAWLGDLDVPIQVTLTAPVAAEMRSDLEALGLEQTDASPGMVLPSLETVPTSQDTTQISEVTTLDELEAYISTAVDLFDIEPGWDEQLLRPEVLADEAFRFFIAQRENQTVACGQLLQKDHIAGVFVIGVRPAVRRQGLGKAMTRAVLRAGRDVGCTIGALDSTEQGYPLYNQMGFETVVEYQHYEPVR